MTLNTHRERMKRQHLRKICGGNAGESWFLSIKKGDTPETNQFSAHVMKLIEMVETGKSYTIRYEPTPEQLAEWEKKREEIKKELSKGE